MFNCVFFWGTKLHTELCFQRGSTSQHQSFKVTFPIKQVYSCSFIKQTKWPHVIYLIYTTACHFCLYMVRVWISLLLSVSRTVEFHRAHTQTRARTPTHTDTWAHTQVSTLSDFCTSTRKTTAGDFDQSQGRSVEHNEYETLDVAFSTLESLK